MDFLPPLDRLLLFIPAALLLAVTPGPAVTYIVTRSIDQGRRAGLVSVLAIASGNAVHAIAAALGLSVILAASSLAFDVVKYLGAAYLIYLGIRALRTPVDVEAAQSVERKSLRRIYHDGVVVGILNPKTALFFLSFLPQFVDNTRAVQGQMLLLGLLFVTIAGSTDSLLRGRVRDGGALAARECAFSARAALHHRDGVHWSWLDGGAVGGTEKLALRRCWAGKQARAKPLLLEPPALVVDD